MKLSICVTFGLFALASSRLNNVRELEEDEEEFQVIIGLKDSDTNGVLGLGLISRLARLVRPRFKRINAVKAVVSRSKLLELQNDPDIAYVEEDSMVYPDAEMILYGLDMVQADSPLIPKSTPNLFNTAACSNPNSFKIGIIDSGLAVDHPDIPCTDINDEANTNCIGKEFGKLDKNDKWHSPIVKFHGTHVAGTLGASGMNNQGIKGVISDGNICFIIGRVFGEDGGGALASDIFEAVEWIVDQGANIINMSLGGPTYHKDGEKLMEAVYNEGVLLVAAAGNEGTKSEHYPANYKTVISVAAVNESRERATFSQYNKGVDIAGPGVDILSTVPLTLGGAVLLSNDSVGALGSYMVFSVEPSQPLSGPIVSCPNLGKSTCPGEGGHFCLIERGEIKFEDKTLNCEAGGGIAAIIYNNIDGRIGAGLAEKTKTKIPAIEISQADGQRLENAVGETITIEEKKGFGYLSGTSMAVPHVVGVAGKIWRACPKCSNEEVEECLFLSAIDLGSVGKDNEFGFGLIQAESAFLCLVETAVCCESEVQIGADALATSPTISPVSAPVRPIINSQTLAPTTAASSSEIDDARKWNGTSEDMISVLLAFESAANDYRTGAIDATTFKSTIEKDLVDPVIKYDCFYEPVNQTLAPLFRSGLGIDALVEIVTAEISLVAYTSIDSPSDIAPGNGVVYYYRSKTGSLLGGPVVTWETVTKLTFGSNGMITEILLQILDPEQIDSAYPSDI